MENEKRISRKEWDEEFKAWFANLVIENESLQPLLRDKIGASIELFNRHIFGPREVDKDENEE